MAEATPATDEQEHPGKSGVFTVVAVVLVAGLLAVALTGLVLSSVTITPYYYEGDALWPYLLFLLFAAVAEVFYVPLRHGDAQEQLTFFEAVLLIGVLIFAPVIALVLPLVGFLVAGLALGLNTRKILFNLGSYALGSAALVLAYVVVFPDGGEFSVISVIGLLVGGMLFSGINMLLLAWILNADQGVPPGEFIREQWLMSLVMAVGSVGIAATAVALAQTTPVLTPFALLPAAALWLAYNSSAQQNAALERNRWIIRLNTAVSQPRSTTHMAENAAHALRRVFEADDICLMADGVTLRADEPGEQLEPHPPAELDHRLVSFATAQPRAIPTALLPPNWRSGVAVELVLADDERGALLLGATRRPAGLDRVLPWASGTWQLRDVDRPVLQALTASMAGALRAGQHLTALTEETAKLTAVVDHATNGIAVYGADGSVLMWSPAMATISAVPAADARAATAAPVLSLRELADSVRGTRGVNNAELAVVRDDGTSRDLNVSVVWIDDTGSSLGHNTAGALAILTVQDVTRERQAERAKSDFIATISHELRTPITPIKGYAQLLSTRWEQMPLAKREKVLRTISDKADHLSRLVDDLLLASNVSGSEGEAKLTIEPSDVPATELTDLAVAGFPDLRGRIERTDHDCVLRCDRDRAVQCLGNLISNAGKYSEPGSVIRVVTHPCEGESYVEIAVHDHGRGIPGDELGRVFDRFYRVEDPMTMTTGGSGLGLYISRELARAMNGDILAESTLGSGSVFTLRLPISRSPASGADTEAR